MPLGGQSLSSILSVAEKSMSSKNYYDAYIKYKEALEFEPSNAEYLYRAAEAGRLLGAYKQSGDYYEELLSHELNNNYPTAAFYGAQMRQIQGQYDRAIASYKIYLSEHTNDTSALTLQAQKEIKACEWAMEQLSKPNRGVSIQRMGEQINTSYSDFAPIAFADTLVFSSLRFENKVNTYIPKRHVASILRSVKDQMAINIIDNGFVDGNLSIAHSAFNSAHDKVIFTVCEDINDHDKRCDLYLSKIDSSGKWLPGMMLPSSINVKGSSTTQPFLLEEGPDGQTILFYSSNRISGSKGGYDIWYTLIDNQGNYSEPVNIESINTAKDEMTPYFYKKSATLYFSSNGHLGFGGFDIYSSKLSDKGYGIPKNIGIPQNSSFDDVYYYITSTDTIAYLSSNRTGSSYLDDASEACCLDIFKLNILPCDLELQALVFNYYTNEALTGVTVKLYDLDQTDKPPVILHLLDSNSFHFNILCDKKYKIVASKPDFSSDSITFFSGGPGEFSRITKRLFLKPEKAQLQILSFNKNTNLSLPGVLISIKDIDEPGFLDTTLINNTGNVFLFPVRPCHRYRVHASKTDYVDVDTVFTIDCRESGLITRKVYLSGLLFSMLPVSLFFDNDRPNPASRDTNTLISYSQTYNAYYKKKKEFAKTASMIREGSPTDRSKEMEAFFDGEVKHGMDVFKEFLKVLEKDLKNGRTYEIFLKGFASPLAKSNYNLNLSNRRIHSGFLEFHRYKNGLFLKYIKSGQLKLSQKPFGETTAPPGISDQRKDLRSIYSVEASRERRVEIIEIKE